MARISHCLTFLILTCVLSLLSDNANAIEGNVYGVISAGYAQNELANYDFDKASYKIGIGYELTPRWYLEGGFVALGEQNAGGGLSANVIEVAGLNFSALGKARNRYGDLFYRLGVSRVSANALTLADDNCPGDIIVGEVDDQLCVYDNTVLAGNLGLGFDLFVHHSAMIRFEVDYTKGEKDFSATAAYIGLRVNF